MTVPQPATPDMMDFGGGEPTPFRLYGEVYYAVPDVPVDQAFELAGKLEAVRDPATTGAQKIEMMHAVVRLLLVDESAERFIERMGSKIKPVGITKFNEVMDWLMSQHMGRPSSPDSTSSTGSDGTDDGTSSTVGSPPPASIPGSSSLAAS